MNNSIINSQRNQLEQLISGASSIGIIVGENQNLDTMGAALGLYLSLVNSGKTAQVVSKKDPIVELSNLFGIDRVAKSFSGTTKVLTISVPYREGEIEKVSYNIEGNKLNVNLFAEENGINFNESDVQYLRKGASPSLIIAIGVADEAEISSLTDTKSVKLITIDSSPLNSIQGDITLVDPNFSSVSEIVAALIRELNLSGDPDAFQNLMDGITFATRNFTNPVTSALAFETAGFLLSNGAKRKDIGGNDRQQNRPDNRFPSQDQFLNRRPRNNRGQNQGRHGQGGNQFQGHQGQQNQPQNRQNLGEQNQGNSQPQNQNRQFNDRRDDTQNRDDIKTEVPQKMPVIDNFQEQMSAPAQRMQKSSTQPMPSSQNDITDASPIIDNTAASDNVPDDWFLPKVFKGSKKSQQN